MREYAIIIENLHADKTKTRDRQVNFAFNNLFVPVHKNNALS